MSLEKLISKLPDDLIRYIYKEFIETELYYIQFIKALETIESRRLNIIKIKFLIPIILSKPQIVKYFSNKILYFKDVYKSHKIDKKKFLQLNNGDSFALSILMYLYH